MVGMFSFLYKITRFILNKSNLQLNLSFKVFISAMMSSLAIFLGGPGDINLVKTIIYPRAVEGIYSILVEYKIITPIEYGPYLVFGLC